MKGQELLKIAFTKLYEEIDDVTYDCEDIFTKLCASGLISEKSFRKIGNKLETFEKNRCMVDALLKGIRNVNQFKKLLQIFYSNSEFYEVAESLKVVFCVLKNEENIVEALNYSTLVTHLMKRNFFTEHEVVLATKCKEVKQIMEILKDKDMHSFKTFLSCLKEMKKDDLVAKMVSLSDEYPSSSLHNFKHFLQKRYTNTSFMETSDIDFNLPISDDINIALVEISEEDHKEESTFFDYYSLLLKQKGGYSKQFLNSYSDIIVENCKVVLIQGYPGSGKTFLARRMCTKWAKGELLQRFAYVVFLQLRDVEVASAKTLDEIIQLYMGSLTKSITEEIYERSGQDTLIILEGWDELPESRRHNSLFTRLISGDLLPDAVIVITSRPSAIRSIPFKVIKRRIEILGFTEQQVKQNINQYFKNLDCRNCTEIAKTFCSELSRLPLLECFVFVPINLSIALYIFNTSDHQLPTTFTDMYKSLVLIQLRRYQAKTSCGIASISNLNSLPDHIGDMLLRLGKMAYVEVTREELTLIFDETKIKYYCFDPSEDSLESFDGMGLLQVTNHRHFESICKSYQFIHRTLQELLAAWYISQQPKSFQREQLQKLFNKKEFEMIWIFYAGLTKFSTVSFKEILPNTFIHKAKTFSYKSFSLITWAFLHNRFISLSSMNGIFDRYYSTKQYSNYISKCISREFQTTLIAAVMEAQNPQLCREMCDSYLFHMDTCWFSVPESAATPQILSALSYCISHSGKNWMIQCKGLDSYGAGSLLKYLTCNDLPSRSTCSKYRDHSDNVDDRISVFDVICSQNQIDGTLKLIQTQKHLQWLILSYCKQVDDNFVIKLSDVLMENTCLKMLHLNGCNITGKSIKVIVHLLKKNDILECLDLEDNMATLTEKDIILLLQVIHRCNNTIFLLFLDKVFRTSHKVQELLKDINDCRQQKSVKILYLTLLDCFDYSGVYQRFISKLPFPRSKVSITYHDQGYTIVQTSCC
ncbi:protein NLRC3-like isoform X2 [Dysidea avara]|uniref:protein NLRC3-like isoform X2 n=1 Tax=Dysidea avara TaxID=196820 RepID=UPI00332B772F